MRLLTLLSIAALVPAIAFAQSNNRRPSADQIVKSLTPVDEPQSNFPATKGIRIEGQRPRTENPPSIDLEVNFEYDSANLTPDARIVLDNLGKALTDPALKASRFLVAGHTDAAGGDAYNLALSARRAQAVADYLQREHAIPSSRLRIEGYGKSKLLDATNPLSAINRRVQVANLGDAGK